MTTKLLLVRHGETVLHAGHRYVGSTDAALDDRGRYEAAQLSHWAKEHRPDALYSSAMERARRTAQAVARGTGLELHVDEALGEVDFGEGETLTLDQLYEKFPDATAAWEKAPAQTPLPGGEPGVIAVARAIKSLAVIVRDNDGGTAMVVMHGTLMRLIICTLLGIDPNRYREIFPVVHNCGITTLEFDGERVSLLDFNVPPLV